MTRPGEGARGTAGDAAARHRFLDEVTRVIAAAPLGGDRLLASLTRQCIPFLADYCSIDLLTENGEIRRVETAHVDPAQEVVVRELWGRFPYRVNDSRGVPEVLRTGEPEFAPEFSDAEMVAFVHDPEQLRLMRAAGPCSYICVPLATHHRVYGALSLVMAETRAGGSGRRYTRDDLATAVEVARRAAVAVDNARHYEAALAAQRESEHAVERMARLQQATAAFARASTVAGVGQAAIGEGLAALGGGAASLGLLRKGGDEIELVATAGYPDEIIAKWRRFPLSAPAPLAEAIRTRDVVVVTSLEERAARFPGRAEDELIRRFPAVVAAPLLVGERVLGALAVSYAAAPTITDDELSMLRTLASLCAQAVERTQLHDAEQRAHARASFLADASEMLGSSLDYEATISAVAQSVVPELADWCSVDMLEDDGSVRQLAVAHVDPAKVEWARELRRVSPPDMSAPMGMPNVLRTGVPELYEEIDDALLVRVARNDEELRLLRGLGFTSAMLVPLNARGRTLGVLTFVSAESGQHYDAEDLALAEELAHRAATAVDNARLFREAETARESAVSANRAKSDFLATMSHEIRTPINAILGYSELLELGIFGPVTDEQRAQLSRIDASTRHLLGLVNEILDLAKVESGTLVVEHEHAIAGDTVNAALALIRPQAAAKGIALAEQCEGVRTSVYVGDEHRARQVLTNLLANAVKFTASGGRIVVRCAVTEHPPESSGLRDGARWVAIRVEDSGIGIAPELLTRIFEPFTQATSGYTREQSGTGLGLTISRRLARLMGGEITVESTPSAGSVFTLWLPAAGDESAPPSPASTMRRRRRPSAPAAGQAPAAPESPAPAEGRALARIGIQVLCEVGAIVQRWRARVRADASLVHLRALPDVQLDDHAATLLTDIALAMRMIGLAGEGSVAELMRDGTEIQRVISERHGAQRFRIGASEAEIARELLVLRDVAWDAVERTVAAEPALAAAGEEARTLVAGFTEQATRISRRAFRLAKSGV